jgi:transglutaminase-like putative cysteine protease
LKLREALAPIGALCCKREVIQAALNHMTSYRYDHPVMLGPADDPFAAGAAQPHRRSELFAEDPAGAHFINWQQDPHGNWLARIVIPEPTSEFRVTVDLIADLAVINPFDFFVEDYASQRPFQYAPDLKTDLSAYFEVEPQGAMFDALYERFATSGWGRSTFWSRSTAR